MNIYILEDDIVQQFRLEELIRNYLQVKNYPVDDLISCNHPRELLAALEETSRNNIYFLDIAIKGNQNAGLELAERIRQIDPIGQINFVTTHTEFAPVTYEYKVNAHDFVDKILPQDDFNRRIIANIDQFFDMNRLKPLNEVFSYKTRTGKWIEALYADIHYFETTGVAHKLLLQMDGETLTMYGNMNEIEKMSAYLVRVHRSFLVNRNFIKKIYKKEKLIILEDNTDIPMSREGYKRLAQLGIKHY